jgi:hypothetical protein
MELTNFQVNLTPGQGSCFKLGQLEGLLGRGPADLCFKEIHVDARACNVMAARGQGLLLVLRLVTNLPSPSQPEVPKQYTYTATAIAAAAMACRAMS